MEKEICKTFFIAKNNEIIFLDFLDCLKNIQLKENDKFFIWGKRIDYNALKTTLIKKRKMRICSILLPKFL